MYKLIACDLDETLLDSDHKIPARVRDAITAAGKKGVKFVPATGRPYGTVTDVLEELGLDGRDDEYVISFNGGALTRNSDPEPLRKSELPFEVAERLWRFGIEHELCIHLYTLDPVYVWNYYDWEHVYIEGRMNIVETHEPTLDFLRGTPLTKILFADTDLDRLRAYEDELARAGATEGLDVVYSSNRYLEFNPHGVNKGAGLAALAELLGIEVADTIAIGDNTNDLAMIRAAGLGCAVANASDDAVDAADYVCADDNNAGGVAEVIEKFVL
ncbi:Cof-type HAD-IIB family hydrolase [Paratractidigestivibacter sp.]|uniref:Cof-type HAD-IIB family hydrolase n=1 Tax=Paratractidigestivibacter sp. TaxID=2847316 RepID=UPI002ABDA1B8|nr:Cof-type HAD-IIB family hydrolase [Paratractidigestivibacter sp.]